MTSRHLTFCFQCNAGFGRVVGTSENSIYRCLAFVIVAALHYIQKYLQRYKPKPNTVRQNKVSRDRAI